jgi:hypothetical protein
LVIKAPATYLDLLNKNMINNWKTIRSIEVPVHCSTGSAHLFFCAFSRIEGGGQNWLGNAFTAVRWADNFAYRVALKKPLISTIFKTPSNCK